MSADDRNLRLGCTILTIGYLALMSASVAIVSQGSEPSSALGRHLWAGALANASLACVEVVIVSIALRKKQKWAWWAALLPMFCYGLPIFILDAVSVSSETLVATLAPQVLGLLAGAVGLILVAVDLFPCKPK